MKRRVFNLLAAVSLVLCLASALILALSPDDKPNWEWHDAPQWDFTSWEIGLDDTGLFVRHYTPVEPAVPGPPRSGGGVSPQSLAWMQSLHSWQFDRWGCRLHRSVPVSAASAGISSVYFALRSELRLPYWLVCILTVIAPAFLLFGMLQSRLRRRLSWRLARQLLCPTCGYDLRATPYRCPECGTEVSPPRDRWLAAVAAGMQQAPPNRQR